MKHTHKFVEEYDGFIGFGLDRKTDEASLIVYLQKFSDDELMNILINRLSQEEILEIFDLLSRILKRHLSEREYHKYFLKE